MDLDAAGLLRLRLAEHAIHSWDINVPFDRGSRVANDAVELLIDGLGAWWRELERLPSAQRSSLSRPVPPSAGSRLTPAR